jgi:uncharacterized protein YhaN
MRLSRLNLTRYGKFTDFFVDFGAKAPGKPDFHVIFGPNEAGKTTTLTAYLDLLFGIEKNSSYNFIHSYETMQVGGILEFSGGAREFVRVKKPANSLRDASLQIISDSAIASELGGLNRNDYRLKFSLDADTLEKGGDNIMASKGDLGELLFAASAGVVDLSQRLNDMREKIDEFFKKGTRKNGLAELKNEIKTLDDRKKEIDTLASRYASLVVEHKKAADLYKAALDERTDALSAKTKVERIEGAMPRLDTLRKIGERLAPLADAPVGSEEWEVEISLLQTQEIELDVELKAALKDFERLTGEIEKIVVDEMALEFADRLGEMAKGRSRYIGAEEDIPKLKPQVEQLNADIMAVLRALEREGEEDAKGLLLPARVSVALRSLMESWAGVETVLVTAEKEASAAQVTFAAKTGELKEAQAKAGVGDPSALAMLASVTADIRKAALESRHDLVVKALKASRVDFDDKIKPLAPWRGGADDLIALRIPDAAQIERWKTALSATKKVHEGYSDDVERLKTELEGLRAQQEAVAATSGVLTDSEAAEKRAEREAAWAEHRRALDLETADAFESRLRANDLAVDARFGHATEIAKVNATLQSIIVKEKDLERTEQLSAESGRKLEAVRAEICAAIKAVSPFLPDALTVEEFAAWTSLVDKAREVHGKVRQGEQSLREIEIDFAAAVERLGKALTKAKITHDPAEGLEPMMFLALTAQDEATTLKTLGQAVEDAKRDFDKRQSDLLKAHGRVDEWKTGWKAAYGSCWIAETHSEPSIPLLSEILAKLEEMKPKLDDLDNLNVRITKMERDQKAFAKDVNELSCEMGEAIEGRPVLVVADRLSDRVKKAHDQNLIRAGKRTDLDKVRDREVGCRDKIAESLERKQKIFAHFGVEALAAAAGKVAEGKVRAGLLDRKAEEEGHILKALGVASMDEAEAFLRDVDQAKLSSDKASAENRFDAADAQQRKFFLEKSKADEQINEIGGDAAVALIEEQRRTICLEIEDKARQWLRLRAGVIAAEKALRIYREKHRSSMMANASEAFKTISRGAYVKLTTQPDRDGEVLVGIGKEGNSKKAPDLSKGTRFQLYLALRVAGYREYAGARQPPTAVPFVADDIMETFDDFRAEEAFRVLADMAKVGQVIYLTHHEHLCGIARNVCPDVRIHKL